MHPPKHTYTHTWKEYNTYPTIKLWGEFLMAFKFKGGLLIRLEEKEFMVILYK